MQRAKTISGNNLFVSDPFSRRAAPAGVLARNSAGRDRGRSVLRRAASAARGFFNNLAIGLGIEGRPEMARFGPKWPGLAHFGPLWPTWNWGGWPALVLAR